MRFRHLLLSLCLCVSVSAYADTASSLKDDEVLASNIKATQAKSDSLTRKDLQGCLTFIDALKALEADVNMSSYPKETLTESQWISLLQTLTKQKAFQDVNTVAKNNTACSKSSLNLVTNIDNLIKPNPDSNSYSNFLKNLYQYATTFYLSGAYPEALHFYQFVGDNDPQGISQYILAMMYENGIGTASNSTAANNWYTKANARLIQTDNKSALLQTLDHFARILTDAGNTRLAYINFLAAAKLGGVMDQFRVAICYAGGYGVPQDNVAAYAWVSTALAQGFSDQQAQMAAQTLQIQLATTLQHDKTGKQMQQAKVLEKQYLQSYPASQH